MNGLAAGSQTFSLFDTGAPRLISIHKAGVRLVWPSVDSSRELEHDQCLTGRRLP